MNFIIMLLIIAFWGIILSKETFKNNKLKEIEISKKKQKLLDFFKTDIKQLGINLIDKKITDEIYHIILPREAKIIFPYEYEYDKEFFGTNLYESFEIPLGDFHKDDTYSLSLYNFKAQNGRIIKLNYSIDFQKDVRFHIRNYFIYQLYNNLKKELGKVKIETKVIKNDYNRKHSCFGTFLSHQVFRKTYFESINNPDNYLFIEETTNSIRYTWKKDGIKIIIYNPITKENFKERNNNRFYQNLWKRYINISVYNYSSIIQYVVDKDKFEENEKRKLEKEKLEKQRQELEKQKQELEKTKQEKQRIEKYFE